MRVILYLVLHYMIWPVGHHQVLLRLGDCCTSCFLLVAFKILNFIYIWCTIFCTLCIYCVPCARSATVVYVCVINVKFKILNATRSEKEVQQSPNRNNT
jgi:hypothetical protein